MKNRIYGRIFCGLAIGLLLIAGLMIISNTVGEKSSTSSNNYTSDGTRIFSSWVEMQDTLLANGGNAIFMEPISDEDADQITYKYTIQQNDNILDNGVYIVPNPRLHPGTMMRTRDSGNHHIHFYEKNNCDPAWGYYRITTGDSSFSDNTFYNDAGTSFGSVNDHTSSIKYIGHWDCFKDASYKGKCLHLYSPTVESTICLTDADHSEFNDCLSSVFDNDFSYPITYNYLYGYWNTNLGGEEKTWTADDRYVGVHWNDEMSSCTWQGQWQICDNTDYTGAQIWLYTGGSLGSFGSFNDKCSSVQQVCAAPDIP